MTARRSSTSTWAAPPPTRTRTQRRLIWRASTHDGKSLSTGIGLQVLAACRMRDAGMSAADIAREAAELHSRSHASFVLDTMEFLAAGGRCPTLVAYLGGKLSCRPGILVDNQSGAMKVGKLYRGKQEKVLERYVSDTLARYTDIVKDEIFITHSGVSDDCRRRTRYAGRARIPHHLHHHGQLHHLQPSGPAPSASYS
ncbi:MAG: DegV family protein [Adlercreutzia equolifaciens]